MRAVSPAFTNWIHFVLCLEDGFVFCLSLSSMSARVWSTWSCLHLYRPCCSANLQPDRMCACVPLAQHNWQFGVSRRPHFSKFEGDGRTSYTDLSRKDIRKGSILHSSLQGTFLSGIFHLVHAPCCPSSTALAFLSSSSTLRTSSCTMSRLSLPLVEFHCLNFDDPRPWRPTQMLPIMSRKVKHIFACCPAWLALQNRPVLVCTPASLTFASFESLSVITRRHFDTLNSSIMDNSGS